jgi:hypothetical protein
MSVQLQLPILLSPPCAMHASVAGTSGLTVKRASEGKGFGSVCHVSMLRRLEEQRTEGGKSCY